METIDCLFVGHNEMNFSVYEEAVRNMGTNSGAYRDLSLNFIRVNREPHSVTDLYNYLSPRHDADPLHVAETFSAAIASLGTYLHRRGLRFDFINAFQSQQEELKARLSSYDIRVVAIITTLYVSELPILEIVRLVRSHNPDARIVLGGPFVSTRVRTQTPENTAFLFESTIGADVYIDSPHGEDELVNVIRAFNGNGSLENIPNLYYKTAQGYKITEKKVESVSIDRNPVDWSLFKGRTGKYVNVRTAVSCPFACSFCGFPEHAGEHQVMGVETIEAELSSLRDNGDVSYIHFIDDTFNVPPKRFKEMLRMMVDRQFDFRWHSYIRCQFLDEETVRLMKDSGCDGVFLGIESGSDKILKNMNKSADAAAYLRGIQLLKKYGITTFGNFIIGFPGETDDTVEETRSFIQHSGLDFFRAQLWYCEPVTPIWRRRDEFQINGRSFEWSHQTMDRKRACDLVDDIFRGVNGPVWVPQYNFDFDTLWHLAYRGMSIDQVRCFLLAFKRGVGQKDGTDAVLEMKQCLEQTDDQGSVEPGGDVMDKYQVKFSF